MSRSIVFLTLVLILTAAAVNADGPPVIQAVRVDIPPVIDGDLSDECWQRPPDVTDFFFTANGTKAEEQTSAWICYDDKYIYAAFYCKDSHPNEIRSQLRKRGGNLGVDDHVWLGINAYEGDGRTGWFAATAGGVQMEFLPWITASKIEWRGDWDTAANRVDGGYVVEMAIPLSMLQYKPGETNMRLIFERSHARLSTTWAAPDVGPNYDFERRYVWQGLILPRPSARPKMMAYSVLGTGEDNSVRRVGMDAKYSITPSLTGLFTLNPYFDDIEQEVAGVDFTYTERHLSDSRPFFQEGGGFFPWSNVLYTRRIENIDAGVRLYGKLGDYALAFMNTQNFGTEDHTVLQVGRNWINRGEIWLCGVNSSTPDINSLTTMISTNYRLQNRENSKIEWHGHYISADRVAGPGRASMYSTSIRRWGQPRSPQFSVAHAFVGSEYEPYLGYVPEKGLRRLNASISLYDQPADGRFQYWNVGLYSHRTSHLDGSLYYDSVQLVGQGNLKNGTGGYVSFDRSHRPPYRDNSAVFSFWWGRRDLYKNGNASVIIGKRAGGDYLSYSVGQGWLIRDRLTMHMRYQNSRIKAPSPEAYSASQLIGTLAFDFDDERTLAGRLVSNAGKSNAYLAYRQRVRKGMDAYCILGDPNAESTRSSLTLKLVRML